MKDQDMKNQEGKSQQNQDNTGKGYGVSGQNPASQEGLKVGSAENTRGENVSSREGSGGGAKQGKDTPNNNSPQGSNANPADTRGADKFRNNQPNASTLRDQKNNENSGNGQ